MANGTATQTAATVTGLVDDPVLGYRYRFAGEGDALEVEIWADPGGGMLLEHYHPALEERFEVHEGEFEFKVDGEKVRLGPGDRVVAAPGVRHRCVNVGTRVARMTAEIDPPLNLQAFLTEAGELAQDGVYNRFGLPRGPAKLLRAAEFADRYRDTTVMTSPAFGPPSLQPFLFGPLARLERRRRRRN